MRVVPETAASHASCSSRLCSSNYQSVSARAVDSAPRSRTRHLRAHPELKSAAGETTGGACLGKHAAVQRPSVRLDAEVAAGSALRCRHCCAICARRCGLYARRIAYLRTAPCLPQGSGPHSALAQLTPAQALHCVLCCEARSVMQQVRRNAVADTVIDNS